MHEMPKLSVIVPVYNAEKYLRQCLDSLCNQTLENIEIICVNDGSVDGSAKILQEYADRDSRVIFVNQKNQGVNAARKNGYLHASGGEIILLWLMRTIGWNLLHMKR